MPSVDSLVYPSQCSAIKKGGMVVIKEKPCKVIASSTSKTGKHGHAKIHMVAVDIFTGKKYEEICPSTHNLMVPNISREELMLVNVSYDGYMTLLLANGKLKEDLKLPSGKLGRQIQDDFDDGKQLLVTVTSAMGTQQAMSCREMDY